VDDAPSRDPGSSGAHPETVHRDPEQVRHGIVDRVDPVPALPELQERVLHQLLGICGAPGDEVERSVQAIVLIEEQVVEAPRGRGRLAVPVELHDVVIGLHGLMDARRARFV
jgi:hypothetical protein